MGAVEAEEAFEDRGYDFVAVPAGPGGTPSGASARAQTGPEYAWRWILPLRLPSEMVTFPAVSPEFRWQKDKEGLS